MPERFIHLPHDCYGYYTQYGNLLCLVSCQVAFFLVEVWMSLSTAEVLTSLGYVELIRQNIFSFILVL